ncbi:hypothetical protein ACAG39_04680 [Caldicellulosiruptoraceae bacterium PP1]
MFAYCKECGYNSGDVTSLESLEKKIEKDGGEIKYYNYSSICPRCKKRNTLKAN